MALMGFREYARHRDCSLRAVQKAIEDRRISVVVDDGGRKKIDSDLADAAWTSNTDMAKRSVLFGGGSSAGAGSGPAVPPLDGDDPPAGPDDSAEYRKARADREKLRLDNDRLDMEERLGRLVDVEEASRAAYTAFRSLRDNLQNLSTRIKHELAAETDADKCERLLDAELDALLGAFDVDAVLRESDDDEDDAE